MNKDKAKEEIKKIIAKYEQVKNSAKINSYTEEETKNAFIKPLFEALGWDFSEKEEVSAEEHISLSGRLDYGFHINGRPKFYLEVKKLKADLNNEEFARQAIKYSFNKGVTWAVLTDFEGLKVFNAQSPSKYLGDKLYFELKYSEYLNRFDQLWLLSKESFKEDLIDQKAIEAGKKLQKIPITELLSKDLNECRKLLTDQLGKWNPEVPQNLLDEGVQKLLDRLIFIKVAEDRKIENNVLLPLINQWRLLTGSNKPTLYQSMTKTFRELDDIYNSNIFTKHSFETWQENGEVLEEVLDILSGKKGYYEFDFSVMSADTLGSVYENYLGYKLSQSQKGLTLHKDAGKRKEQGIYYTPPFIVDYIVRNALKPVLDNCRSVNDLKKIKVLDPACGSGSFLTKALEVILEKYKDFNYDDTENLRIEIILENIYGVDLDEQAVEIARLNLLVNALKERGKLPSLENNIKNGNSLISGTDKELERYFGKNFRDKKPFNWQEEFPEVFKQGGFDVIIGNPPYGVTFDPESKKYLENLFPNVPDREIYIYFISRGLALLREGGILSYIFPNTFLSNLFSIKYRKNLLDNFTIDNITDLSEDNTFQEASVRTCIVSIFNKKKDDYTLPIYNLNPISRTFIEKQTVSKNILSTNIENWLKLFSSSDEGDKLIKKVLSLGCVKIDEICEVSQGLIPYDKYRGHDELTIKNRIWHSEAQKDPTYKKELKGSDVSRYNLTWNGKLWISYGNWLAAPRNPKFFKSPRILVREIVGSTLNCTYTEEEFYNTPSIINIISKNKSFSLYFILAILNSNFIGWYHKKLSPKANKGLFPKILINDVRKIIIPKLSLEEQQVLIAYSQKMLVLNNNLNIIESNSNKWHEVKSEIEKVEKKINEEVYKLYGLTSEEITVIEKNG